MKLQELLQEETLQQAVKRLLKPAGTLSKVMGRDASAAGTLLSSKPNEPAFVLRPDTAVAQRMLKSVANSRPYETSDSDDHGTLRVVRVPGGAKLLVVGDGADTFVVTTEYQKDRLIEAVEPKW